MFFAPPPTVAIVGFHPPQHLVADGTSSFTLRAKASGDYTLRVTSSSAYGTDTVAKVTDAGNGKFTVVPAATARYRVQAVDDDDTVVAESDPVTVIAHPLLTLTSKRLGGGALELHTSGKLVRGDLSFKPRAGSATEATFYYRLDGRSTYSTLATEPLTAKGCCARAAVHPIYDTALLSGIRSFRVCFAGRLFTGAGEKTRCPETLAR